MSHLVSSSQYPPLFSLVTSAPATRSGSESSTHTLPFHGEQKSRGRTIGKEKDPSGIVMAEGRKKRGMDECDQITVCSFLKVHNKKCAKENS